jgi:hypothetical protein
MSENRTLGKKPTPRQRKAIEALLTTGDKSAAARAAQVRRSTIYRWLRQPHFQAALAEAEAEALVSLSRTLVRLGDKAGRTLESAMDDPDAALSHRIRAADIVLSRLLQLRELVDLEARVCELERKLAGP